MAGLPEGKPDSVAVVIANWNGAGFIARCLDAVFAQTHAPSEVVVVDNGSTDDSVALIQADYPTVRLIQRPTNEGFARGYNLGIAQTQSDYVLILNTDVFLDRDFLFEALKAIGQSPDIGSVAAKLFKTDTGEIDNVGLFLQPWLKVVNSKHIDASEFVFAGSGAALFCRRAMLDDIAFDGAFLDEIFFLFWEDTDLSWRAQLRGWRCVFSPSVTALHVGSASQGGKVRTLSKPPFLQRLIWRNRYLIVAKNVSFAELIFLAPWLLLGEVMHWVLIALRLPRRLPLFALAHFDFVRLLPETLRKRRHVQRRRRIGARAVRHFFRF